MWHVVIEKSIIESEQTIKICKHQNCQREGREITRALDNDDDDDESSIQEGRMTQRRFLPVSHHCTRRLLCSRLVLVDARARRADSTGAIEATLTPRLPRVRVVANRRRVESSGYGKARCSCAGGLILIVVVARVPRRSAARSAASLWAAVSRTAVYAAVVSIVVLPCVTARCCVSPWGTACARKRVARNASAAAVARDRLALWARELARVASTSARRVVEGSWLARSAHTVVVGESGGGGSRKEMCGDVSETHATVAPHHRHTNSMICRRGRGRKGEWRESGGDERG
jgi:hypothetical protein